MLKLLTASLLLVVLFFVVRSRKSSARNSGSTDESISAAEAEPTATGRYRVQKMLASQTPKPPTAQSEVGEEESVLPDPFTESSSGQPQVRRPTPNPLKDR